MWNNTRSSSNLLKLDEFKNNCCSSESYVNSVNACILQFELSSAVKKPWQSWVAGSIILCLFLQKANNLSHFCLGRFKGFILTILQDSGLQIIRIDIGFSHRTKAQTINNFVRWLAARTNYAAMQTSSASYKKGNCYKNRKLKR